MITFEEIKKRLPNHVTLDESTYLNTNTKCRFIDDEYGSFWKRLDHVLDGSYHPDRNKNNKNLTKLNEIKSKIPKYITLDEDSFKGLYKTCRFIDEKYGEYWTKPYSVLKGRDHIKRSCEHRKISISEIKSKLPEYIILDESTYIDTKTKCRFIDKNYGSWEAIPRDIINGHEHPKRGLEKRKETCLKRYDVEHPSQCDEIKKKYKETCLVKYGIPSTQTVETKNKNKETCLIKYGVKNVFQSEKIKNKIKETNLKRFGFEHNSQSQKIKDKKIAKSLKKFGVENPNQSEEIKNKKKITCLQKYGFEYPLQNAEVSKINSLSNNKSKIKYHWKDNSVIACIASYEESVVDFLNHNKIEYSWHPKSFKMPNKKVYIPDLFFS